MEKYGHLRPGTYDINSLRYDETADLYFDWNTVSDSRNEGVKGNKGRRFSLSLDQMHRLKELLEKNRLDADILGLMDFIKTVIEGREYGKFVFTRILSKTFQMIGELGSKYGLSRDDCAYINIQPVRGLYSSTNDIERVMR